LPEIDFGNLALWFIAFLFSLTIHESAHAWTSERFGDNTGRYLGRITLNPIPHIDPWGTIVFPLVGQMFGGVMFGWAKPVPVNPYLWREKVKANICTSAAGPVSNLLLTTISLIIAKVLIAQEILAVNAFARSLPEVLIPVNPESTFLIPVARIITIMVFLNISLGIFNLVPIPPLDGSHIFQALLPPAQADAYEQIRPYGFLLLFGLLALGVFGVVVTPFFNFGLMILGSSARM
jgi:Zn-dependent protease